MEHHHNTLKNNIFLLFFLAMFVGLLANPVSLSGQPKDSIPEKVKKQKDCTQKDIGDVLRRGKEKTKPPRKTMLLVLPNIAYNPVNGFTAGVAGSAGFYLGNRETTRVSSIGFNAAVTTKHQLLFFIKSNIYTLKNKFFLQGDWRYFIYNSYTWGLGTNSPDSIKTENEMVWQAIQIGDIEDGFPMDYNYIKFHEIFNYKLTENNYAGIGYHLDHYYDIKDKSLQLHRKPYELTPHFVYSELYGFDTSNYTLSGLSLNYVFDSRDNLINPYRGYYVNVNYRFNPEFLGSDRNSSNLWLEFRTYLPLSKKMERHLVGFWVFSNIRVSGRQPYMTLMALGEDQRARSGRGYIAGRYRGENYVYGEVEYRFPISQCSKVLGGVLFLNASTVSNDTRDVSLFEYIRPGVGVGLRFMGYKSEGYYFSGTETF